MRADKLVGEELERMLDKAVKAWREDEDLQTMSMARIRKRFYMVPPMALKRRLDQEGLLHAKPVCTLSTINKVAKVPGVCVGLWPRRRKDKSTRPGEQGSVAHPASPFPQAA